MQNYVPCSARDEYISSLHFVWHIVYLSAWLFVLRTEGQLLGISRNTLNLVGFMFWERDEVDPALPSYRGTS
jgi:hypothetical protein